MTSPKKRKIKTEKIKNSRPATAATIWSLPAFNFCWSPEEVRTLIEPMTIKIKAMPPARPRAIVRILPTNCEGSAVILPILVWQTLWPVVMSILQGFWPTPVDATLKAKNATLVPELSLTIMG